jgi:hypothetical protein
LVAKDRAFVSSGSAFTGVASQSIVNAFATEDGDLVRGDVNGDAVADPAIRVYTSARLTSSDFYL